MSSVTDIYTKHYSEERKKQFEDRVKEVFDGSMSEESVASMVAEEFRTGKKSGGRIGFKDGNGVADKSAQQKKFSERVIKLMDEEGYDFGEAVKEAMKEGYATGGRIGFSKGKAVMTLADAIMRLTKGYIKVTGKKPEGLDVLKIKMEAAQKVKDANKVVDMSGNVVDTSKGIMGGKQILENKEFGKALKEALMKKDNPFSDLVNFEKKVLSKTPQQRRLEAEEALRNKNVVPIKDPLDMATGGRAGYYGGGQAMVGEDLSEIGHGSDALMARNMQIAPGGQATTSTGLNYLLGQDNDTARVPYNKGNMVLPKPKPKNFSRTLDMLNTKAAANMLDTKTYANLVGEFAKKAFDNGELSEVEYIRIIQPLFGEVGEMVTNQIQDDQNYLEKYADGGRIGYKDGIGPKEKSMEPGFKTNDPKKAAKEIIKRLIKLDTAEIPISDKISIGLGPNLEEVGIKGIIDLLGGELSFGGGMKGDESGVGFNFTKNFSKGGIAGMLGK